MAIAMPATSSDSEKYQKLFEKQTIKRTEIILRRVQQTEATLSPKLVRQSLHLLEHALDTPAAWSRTASLLHKLAPKMEQTGYRDEWLPFLERGIQQSEYHQDRQTRAELHFQIGILLQLRSRYDEARYHFEISVAEFEQLQIYPNVGRALNRLAVVNRLQNQLEEATRFIEQALPFLEEDELAFNHLIQGLIAYSEGNWQQAVYFFKKSLHIAEKINDDRLTAWGLNNLGLAFQSMENFQEAATLYKRAIALFNEIHDPVNQAIAEMNLGNIYLSLDQFEEAIEAYWPAERIFRQTGSLLNLAQVKHNISMAYRHLEEWDKAQEAYEANIEQWKALDNIERLVNALEGLGLVYIGQQNFTDAQRTFEEGLALVTPLIAESDTFAQQHHRLKSHLKNLPDSQE